MKKFLLIIFALVFFVVVAFAVFVMSIDWNEHKAKISDQISELTGKKVEFDGPVELKFFPSPYLTVENVKIYSEKPEITQPLSEIRRLVANLELIPFIKGEFNVKKMSLELPLVRVFVQEDGSCNWDTELSPEQRQKMEETQVKLDSLSIEKAVLTFRDAKRGIDWTFRNLSAEVMADSLLGPYRIEGSYIKDSNPAGFAFSIGRLTDNLSTTINAVINNPASQTMLRFDGSVLLQSDILSGSVVFESKKLMQFVTENFKNFDFDAKYDMPLIFSTQVNTTPQKAEFTNLVLKYGNTAGAGNVIIPLSMIQNPLSPEEIVKKVEVAFNLTDLDLEPIVYFLKNQIAKYENGEALVIAPKTDIIADIKAVNVNYGQHVLKNAELSLDILKEKVDVNSLKVSLIGNSNLELWGSIFAGKNGEFLYQSEAKLLSSEFDALLKSLGVNLPSPVDNIYRNFNSSIKIAGGLNEVKFTPAEFIIDKTKVNGEGAIVKNKDGNLKVLMIADVDGINFDNYLPPLPEEIQNGNLNEKLAYLFSKINLGNKVNLQMQLGLGWGIYNNLPFEKLELGANVSDGVWNVESLKIPSFVGANVEASGVLKPLSEMFEFENVKYKFETADIAAWLSKFSVKLPDWEMKDFKKFVSEGTLSGSLNKFAVNNSLNMEGIEVNFEGDVAKENEENIYSGKLSVKAPDFLKMLKSFKINYAPNVYSLGVFNFDANVSSGKEGYEAKAIVAAIGQNQFRGNLTYASDKNIKKISGNLNINQLELERFIYNNTKGRTDKDVVAFKSAEGEESVAFLPKPVLSTTKFNYDDYKNWFADLSLIVDKMSYQNVIFQNSKLKLQLQDSVLNLKDFSADYEKGRVSSEFNIDFKETPTVKGSVQLNKVNLNEKFWSGSRYGLNYGIITSKTNFSSSAESFEEFVKLLDAESEFKIEKTEFKGFNFEAIESDLLKRTDVEGLSKFVQDNLETGKTIWHSINGIMRVTRGDYSLEKMSFGSPLGVTLAMAAKGNLLSWDVVADFSVKFRRVNLPAIDFAFSGSLVNPILVVDVKNIMEQYQRQHSEFIAKKKAEEEAKIAALQAAMNEQMNIAKAMETKLSSDLRKQLKSIGQVAKNDQVISELAKLDAELTSIETGVSEVLTLGLNPQIEQIQIDDAKRKNGLLQKRIENAENILQKANVEDIKYRANVLYTEIAQIHKVSQDKLASYKQAYDNLKNRIGAIQTNYSLENDPQVSAYNAVIESLFVELDDISTTLSLEYMQLQNSFDGGQLAEYEVAITEKLSKAKNNQANLAKNIEDFYIYALPQVEQAEKEYADKKRKEEIARKVKENTGKISVAGVGGKSVTVVRDIEDIEKSESLQEQEKIPVLDFTKKTENVVINKATGYPKKSITNENVYLRKTQGKISGATGVIVRK